MKNLLTETEEIKIPLSKAKMILGLLGSLGFVALGIWLVFFVADIGFRGVIAGWASIIFFGLCATFFAFKVFDSKPGLIINSEGILDNSSALESELIKWEEIEGIGEIEVKNQKFIQIFLKNPEAHIAKHKGYVKYLMKINYKWYGSPVNIGAHSLKTNFKSLKTAIQQKLIQARA